MMSLKEHTRNRLLFIILTLVSFSLCQQRLKPAPEPALPLLTPLSNIANAPPSIDAEFVTLGSTNLVHAPALAQLQNGRIQAVWFAGSREGAGDVEIKSALYQPDSHSWSEPVTLVDRSATQHDLKRFIRKLGNPVIAQAPSGRLWLFYVTVSLGGWATSNISYRYSDDQGLSWSATRRLITSPFLNISTLLKGPAVFYRDGSFALPVYHELAGKYGEILHLDPQGKLLDKHQISYGRKSLQPIILSIEDTHQISLMRNCGDQPRFVWRSESLDGGLSWSPVQATDLPNPNSALTALVYGDAILAVANDSHEERNRLSLLRSRDDGRHWELLYEFENVSPAEHLGIDRAHYEQRIADMLDSSTRLESGLAQIVRQSADNVCEPDNRCYFQYDYPFMFQDHKGNFHLLYTWNKSLIKHVRFNAAWVDSL